MGLFSDPCPNEDCGARVKKRANFCSRCGWAGPNSLTSCPACSKRVGRTSKFCWNCGADLEKERPPRIMGDRWVREDEELAVRINPNDLEGFLSRRVTVEPGTIGLVDRDGRITEEKEWGSHTLEGMLNLRKPSSIILITASDIVLRPTFRGLTDVNRMALDVTVQAVLRVKDFDAFVRHFFEGHKRRITYTILESQIGNELHDVMRGLICAHSLEDMYGNLEWRNQLESELRDSMTVTLDRYGLDLLQVNFVDFGGDHYEQLMQDRGEVYMGNHAADHLAEKQAIRRRMLELESEGKLDEFGSEKELAQKIATMNREYEVKSVLDDAERDETIAQARHELELKHRLRTIELEDLEDERAKLKQDEQLAREQALEKLTVQHQEEVAMSILIARQDRDAKKDDFEREQIRLRDEQTLNLEWQRSEQRRRNERADAVQRYELSVEKAKSEAAARLQAIQVDKEEKQLARGDREHQVEMLRRIQEQEMAMLRTVKALALEETKLEFDYKRFEKEKDTDVALASIEGNVKIATAEERTKAAVGEAKAEQLEKRLDDQKATTESLRQDADRRAADLKDMATIVGRNQSQGTVVVTNPGGGAQVVGDAAGASPQETPCPDCGRPVPLNANFCGSCGRKMS